MSATAPPLPSDLPTEGQYAHVDSGAAPAFHAAAPPAHPYEAYKPAAIGPEQVQGLVNKWGEQNLGCCTSKKAVDTLKVEGYDTGAAYDYTFESFTESRSLHQVHEPHAWGSPVDGPQNGPAPAMWQMVVEKQPDFVSGVSKYEVPHTAMVATCFECIGRGRVECTSCNGRGRKDCIHCNRRGYKQCISCRGNRNCFNCKGTGRNTLDRSQRCITCSGSGNCNSCNGRGRKECISCSGMGYNNCHTCNTTGMVTCPTCDGMRCLKHFQQLRVDYNIQQDKTVVKYDATLPDAAISKQQGTQIIANKGAAVYPISGFCEPAVDTVSQGLSAKHAGYHSGNTIIHAQRHNLRAIPIHSVAANGDEGPWKFWIVGTNHYVHSDSYPNNCKCTIM